MTIPDLSTLSKREVHRAIAQELAQVAALTLQRANAHMAEAGAGERFLVAVEQPQGQVRGPELLVPRGTA